MNELRMSPMVFFRGLNDQMAEATRKEIEKVGVLQATVDPSLEPGVVLIVQDGEVKCRIYNVYHEPDKPGAIRYIGWP